MRSIRRSMTVYLLVLLAVTLGVAWVVIDQATARALRAREAAGAELIERRYQERVREEHVGTDQALLHQARDLGNAMQAHYTGQFFVEIAKFQRLTASAHWMFLENPLAQVAWTATTRDSGSMSRPNPVPGMLFRSYFSNLPLPEEYIQHHDNENPGDDYFQVNTLSGREWHSRSLGGHTLAFDPKVIDARQPDAKPTEPGKTPEAPNLVDWVFGLSAVGPNKEPVRRVMMKVPYFAGNILTSGFRPPRPDRRDGPPGGGQQPRSMLGSYSSWILGFGPPPPGFAQPPGPGLESLPRLYIQCARPQATIDAALTRFAAERDEDLANLSGDIREARQQLRGSIAAIGLLAFLAIAVGGPLLVGRGLRPVGKLSDAVSRVSEKDFKLPHDGSDLSVELVPIHARLTQTLDLLQRAFAREKQAVADISHELRTPIAALMATIDVALRKPRTSEQYRSALEDCRLISKQLGQLVERIMTLASLDAGNDRTQISLIDVAEMATGCAAVIRPLAAAHGVTVEVAAEGPLDLETDSPKLREVLMNLLHNSVEYNRPGGQIDLSVWSEDQSIIIEVRDTGIGMTPDVKDKIFERFYRADPSRQATGIHAGLGLAIVKEYVNRLGGTITVESSPDVGSTFRVTIPAPLIVPSATEKAGAVPVSANP